MKRWFNNSIILIVVYIYQTTMKSKEERIEELEEALRESVRITAEREMVMAEQQLKLDEAEKSVSLMTV